MTVMLPDAIERQFTPEDIRLHLALGMFLDRRVTLGRAQRLPASPKVSSSMNWAAGGFPSTTMRRMRSAEHRHGGAMGYVMKAQPEEAETVNKAVLGNDHRRVAGGDEGV